MPARTITIAGLGDFRQLQTELERTGVIADKSGTTIANSSKRAGAAAAEQAKLVGLSADQQVAAAGRAAAAFSESQAKMTAAQKAAATAAAEAGRAAGLSADQQVAAAKRAADAQKAAADAQVAAAKKSADHAKAQAHAHTTISKAGGVVALGLAGAAVEAVKLGEGYQTAQASIQGATGQTSKSLDDLTHHFEATAGSSMESGQAMEGAYAGVAGVLKLTEGRALSTAEAMKFSAAANNLAEGTGIGVATSYAAVAKVMQTFHLSASQAGEASDTLYSTSKALGVPVEQVASAMGKLHARLGDVAPSLRDTAGLMTLVGEHGLTGGRGVMVVNTAFQTLLGGSKKTDDVLKALGVSVYDSNGKFVGMQSVISQLQPKLSGLTQQQQRYAESALFGKAATEVMGQVIKAGVPAFDQATAAATRHGAALKAAEAQQKTFSGEMKTLKATVETLGGDLGLVLIPKITAVAKALAEGIQWLERNKAAAEALGIVITGVLGAAVTVFAYDKAAAFGKGVAGMVSGLKSLAATSSTTAGEVGVADGVMVGETDAAAAAMKAALLTTGIGAALVLLGTAAFELEEHWSTVMKALEAAATKAANAIVAALNKAKEVVEDTASLGIIPLLQSTGVIHGPVVPNVPGVSEGGTAGAGGKQEGQTAAERSAASLQNLGLGWAGAQGVVKALQGETQGNLEKGATEENKKEGAYGIAQWVGSRKAGLEAFAKGKHQPKSNLEVQLEYLAKELKGPEHGTLTALQHAHGANEAAGIFIKRFERPEVPGTVEQRAAGYAPASNKALQEQMEEASGAKPKKKAAGTKAKAEPYVEPLEAAKQTSLDEGVDYVAKVGSAVKAIGAGVITKIIGDWYKGQPLIEEQLSQGARKGQDVYYAEGLTAGVREGQHVSAGQAVGRTTTQPTGLELGFGGPGGQTLAQAAGEHMGEVGARGTKAGVEYEKFISSIGKGGNVLSQVSKAAETAEKAEAKRVTSLEAAAKKLLGEVAPRQSLTGAIQTGTVPQLEKVLGYSSTASITSRERRGGVTYGHSEPSSAALARTFAAQPGGLSQAALEHQVMPTLSKSAESTGPGKDFNKMVAELKASGMTTLAAQLVQAHKQALADLGRELYAVTQEKQGQLLTAQATEQKDRTTQTANLASKELQIAKDQSTQVTDAMSASARQIDDATQLIKNSFSAMVEAVQLATQRMSDVASGQVQQTQDTTATKVAELAERGKYGLELVAQKLEVQLDTLKASYDIQIQQAKIALDNAKISGQSLIAEKQQNVDLLQAHEDALVATAQAHSDAVQVAQDQTEATAQAQLDAVQLASDIGIDLAKQAQVLVASGTKAQQDAAKGFAAYAQSHGEKQLAAADARVRAVEAAANATIQQAQGALAQAQGESALAVANAQQALAQVEGASKTAIANAEAGLASIEGTAKVAEAGLEGKLAIERERAQVQYAGSGLVVNMYGLNPSDAQANAAELGWELRHLSPG